jgi:hypothetical protein
MTFADVDQRYLALKQQFDAGDLTEEEFDDALRALMIQDELGRWWAKARDSGQWNYYDAVTQTWTPAAPPQPTAPPVMPPPPPAQSFERSTTSQASEPGMVEAQGAQSAAQWHGGAAYAPAAYTPAAYAPGQPELSPGLKVVFYILSFLVPIVGIVLFFVYRGKPAPEDRAAAKLFLILGVIAFALSCVCPLVFSVFLAMLAPLSGA